MTDYIVSFTARSRGDLLEARRWLNQPGSGSKARLKMAKITRALAELRFSPERWPHSPYPNVRRRFVEGYTAYYRIDEKAGRVRIIRIFGPGQDRSTL